MVMQYQDFGGEIKNKGGQKVPVIAFYSVQGGVGKSTLARKFAELVTIAPGLNGRKPNVLLIDLDVEAMGLTYRLTDGMFHNIKTVHEVIAERNVTAAQAIPVTDVVSLSSLQNVKQDQEDNPGNRRLGPKKVPAVKVARRGELYLVPAAPPNSQKLFDTIAGIEKDKLRTLLVDMIRGLVHQFDISCVVIDCAPGANPYTAAAAALADIPFLIGRNEPATYEQIKSLPERFREWYSDIQPAKQKVIINAVSVVEYFKARAERYGGYGSFEYIPMTADVILQTEGLPGTSSLRMLLFESYIIDIMRPVFNELSMNYLIPEDPEVLPEEWLDMLSRLKHCEEAPKMRLYARLRRLRLLWVGLVVVAIGIVLAGARQWFQDLPETITNVGIVIAVVGVTAVATAWYVENERQQILTKARNLVEAGPEGIFEKLKGAGTDRKILDSMKEFSKTIPDTSQ